MSGVMCLICDEEFGCLPEMDGRYIASGVSHAQSLDGLL